MQNLIYMAGRIIHHARRRTLRIFEGHGWASTTMALARGPGYNSLSKESPFAKHQLLKAGRATRLWEKTVRIPGLCRLSEKKPVITIWQSSPEAINHQNPSTRMTIGSRITKQVC